jgi:hypothetical protein
VSLVQGLNDEWYTVDAPEDVEVIAVLIEDSQGNPADAADVADFVSFTDVTFPVLGDEEATWIEVWGSGDSGSGRHTYTIIGTDGTIGWRKDDGSSGSVEEITAGLAIVE